VISSEGLGLSTFDDYPWEAPLDLRYTVLSVLSVCPAGASSPPPALQYLSAHASACVCTQGGCGVLPGPMTAHRSSSPSPARVFCGVVGERACAWPALLGVPGTRCDMRGMHARSHCAATRPAAANPPPRHCVLWACAPLPPLPTRLLAAPVRLLPAAAAASVAFSASASRCCCCFPCVCPALVQRRTSPFGCFSTTSAMTCAGTRPSWWTTSLSRWRARTWSCGPRPRCGAPRTPQPGRWHFPLPCCPAALPPLPPCPPCPHAPSLCRLHL
jgi:hypothetical protein